MLTRFVQRHEYELDGVVFAVWGNDLDRLFRWWDDQPREHTGDLQQVLMGRSKNWKLDETSRGAAVGTPYVRWYVVPPSQLDDAPAGDWRPKIDRTPRLFLWRRAQQLVASFSESAPSPAPSRPNRFNAGQRKLIERTRRALNELNVPALVLRVPNRIEDPSWEGDAQRFWEMIGARFIDGGLAFDGLSERDFDALWLPVDGHWHQRGSDRFAEFAHEKLVDWP